MRSNTANHSVSFRIVFSHSISRTAHDSAALAEKLLNDMLKATEAFNKLKKQNDELKSKLGSESQYVSA